MKIIRTSNAGILLELDNVKVLLDGVCGEVFPYIKTPSHIKTSLTENFPDIVAFTHLHNDHFDSDYAEAYKTKTHRPVFYGSVDTNTAEYKNIRLLSVPTRHIGKTDIAHSSFCVCGSKTVWFMGDASPVCLEVMRDCPQPDVLVVPYAYALTQSAWQKTKSIGAKYIVLVHLPDKQNDSIGLWQSVLDVTKGDICLYIPQIEKTLIF